MTDLESRFDGLCCGPYPEALKAAMLLPISGSGTRQLAGLMIAGISTPRALDDNYRGFLDLLAGSVATALSHARAYEEERKRAEALAAIDKAKTAFFSNVSHEFRTPLTLTIGPLESILNGDGAVFSQVREQVETAHRNSLRLLKLVNSLLDFSRIEAGRMKALYEPVDLSSLTEDLASNFRSAMVAGGLDLIVECTPLRERIYVDREMWEKIVLNLLSNAFKFTFEGRVHVTLREEGGHAVLSVRDSGIGVSEEELPHIFERFYRVEGARGRTYEGSGIGLALIQELVKLHGGTIAVDSEINKGSIFTVAIPFGTSHLPQDRINPGDRGMASTAVRAEAFSGEALTWVARDRLSDPSGDYLGTAPTAANSAHARILLADDNADMREHVTRVLGTGYEVIAVNDGDAALKAARDTRPELVISDVMMPGLDGFGLLKALRADRELCEVPVILLSARAGEEARTEGITAGADDYLTKPFAATELVARVETTLSLQRLRQEAREEIARSERQFRAFVTATSDVIYRVSPDWCEMRHLQGQNFIADTDEASPSWIEKYILPEDRASVMSAIHQAIEGKRPFELEHRIIRVDGTTGWTFSRAVPLTDARGQIVEWFGTARDITARKRTELELHRANQALEQFAYTASHDLQEPLRTLKIYSELLTQRRANLDKESHQFLNFIRSGASRMEAMLRDLLKYTQTSLLDVPTAPVDAAASLRTALDNLAGLIAETGGAVESGPLPFLPVHETDLQHLFQNLVGNSIKYRRPDVPPQIRILAERCVDGWQFSVSDNGIGIQPEHHERIFRLFERLHERSAFSGTGIGLSICQRIVERHHGRIWVDSRLGSGATFYFILPA